MSEEKNKKEPKGKKGLIVVIALLLVIIIGGGAFGFYYLKLKANSAPKEEKLVEASYSLDEIIINLADEGSKRYVKVKVVVAYDSKNKDLATEVEGKAYILRDLTLNALNSKKVADLNPKGREALKDELLVKFNSTLTNGKLTNIYYHDFLVQ